MTHHEQINAFQNDLKAVIHRYRSEFELTLADAVGVIELVKLQLWLGEEEANKGEVYD